MHTTRIRGNKNDRAVSESIGFIIIFGIIIAGIGLVTLYGYPMLLQQQSSSDEQIMEKNMIVLQNDLKSLAYKTVPYKETSLKVGGGSLTVYNMSYKQTTFSIYDDSAKILKEDGTFATAALPLEFSPGSLRYESTSAQTGMALENGAVVKRMLAQEGSTMLAEPRWFYDSQTHTAVIYLIGFNATDIMSQSGIGTVKMELDPTKTTSAAYDLPAGDKVYVKYTNQTIDTDYSTAWENYFVTTMKMDGGTAGPDLYRMPTDMTRLVINRYEIIIKSV